jgi:hypothetical protein
MVTVGLIAMLGALTWVPSAIACSCAPRSPAEGLREADGAIAGRLVKVVPHGPLHAVYRYRVLRVYKGAEAIDAGRMVSVQGARRAAACALPRRIGHRYGLFLLRHNGRWTGSICGVVAPRRLGHAAQQATARSARAAQPLLCA